MNTIEKEKTLEQAAEIPANRASEAAENDMPAALTAPFGTAESTAFAAPAEVYEFTEDGEIPDSDEEGKAASDETFAQIIEQVLSSERNRPPQKAHMGRSVIPMTVMITIFVITIVGLCLNESREGRALNIDALATMTMLTSETSAAPAAEITAELLPVGTALPVRSVNLSSTTVMLGKKVMGFPCVIDDFTDIITDPTAVLGSGECVEYKTENGEVKLYLSNFSDEDEYAEDCDITAISVSGWEGRALCEISINGVTIGSSAEQLTQAFGKASSIGDGGTGTRYVYKDLDHLVEVIFIVNNGAVMEIQYGAY